MVPGGKLVGRRAEMVVGRGKVKGIRAEKHVGLEINVIGEGKSSEDRQP